MAPTNAPKHSNDQKAAPTAQDTANERVRQLQSHPHVRPLGVNHQDAVILDAAPPPLSRAQKRRRTRARHNRHTAFQQGAPSATSLRLAALVNERAENISAVGQAQMSESCLEFTTQLPEQHIPRGYLLPKVHKVDSNHKYKAMNRVHPKIFFCIAENTSENQDQDNNMEWSSSDMSQPSTMLPSLLGMSPKIRGKILAYVLVSDHKRYMEYEEDEFKFSNKKLPSDHAVKPYYQSLSGDRPFHLIYEAPWNKDISILLVNKQLYKEALAILYGERHQFVLKDAKVVQWWTTQLGDTMKMLNTLVIELDAGFSHLCVPREKIWLNLFRQIAKQQTLQYLAVSFAGWDDELNLKRYGRDEYTRDCAIRARNDTIECLHTIRGLKQVLIAPWDYMSDEAAKELCGCMVAKGGIVLERTLKAQAIEKKWDTPLTRLLATLPH